MDHFKGSQLTVLLVPKVPPGHRDLRGSKGPQAFKDPRDLLAWQVPRVPPERLVRWGRQVPLALRDLRDSLGWRERSVLEGSMEPRVRPVLRVPRVRRALLALKVPLEPRVPPGRQGPQVPKGLLGWQVQPDQWVPPVPQALVQGSSLPR